MSRRRLRRSDIRAEADHPYHDGGQRYGSDRFSPTADSYGGERDELDIALLNVVDWIYTDFLILP